MTSKLKRHGSDNDTLMVFFGGMAKLFGGIPPFEFLNFTEKHFSHITRIFYVDLHQSYYTKGFEGFSKNYDESVEHLRKEMAGYNKVNFYGVSAGGYAAILFGSLLNVNQVVSFGGPTKIDRGPYQDLIPVINDKTLYNLYCIPGVGPHDPIHVRRVDELQKPNVKCDYTRKAVKILRDNGTLLKILQESLE
jgi:hypothetical protein